MNDNTQSQPATPPEAELYPFLTDEAELIQRFSETEMVAPGCASAMHHALRSLVRSILAARLSVSAPQAWEVQPCPLLTEDEQSWTTWIAKCGTHWRTEAEMLRHEAKHYMAPPESP